MTLAGTPGTGLPIAVRARKFNAVDVLAEKGGVAQVLCEKWRSFSWVAQRALGYRQMQ